MLACALGSALLAVIVGYLAAKIAADFSHNVRGKVFHKVFDFGAGEISKFSTSSLITRTTNDITQIQMLVAMGLQVMIKAPIMAAWAIVKIVGKSWQLSVLTASAVVLIMVVIGTLMAVLLPKFKTVQKQVDDVNRVTRENLTELILSMQCHIADAKVFTVNCNEIIIRYSIQRHLFIFRNI